MRHMFLKSNGIYNINFRLFIVLNDHNPNFCGSGPPQNIQDQSIWLPLISLAKDISMTSRGNSLSLCSLIEGISAIRKRPA